MVAADVAERPFVVGLHVWNFADFKTGQGTSRAGGMNFKGVFTRDRRPKGGRALFAIALDRPVTGNEHVDHNGNHGAPQHCNRTLGERRRIDARAGSIV